jgi:hypothetical protein
VVKNEFTAEVFHMQGGVYIEKSYEPLMDANEHHLRLSAFICGHFLLRRRGNARPGHIPAADERR